MVYDSHLHSLNSDGRNSVDEMCIAAVEKGVCGITITDHANMARYHETDTLRRIKNSFSDTMQAKEKYKDKLKVLFGAEIGEYIYAPEEAKELLSFAEYDSLLCSLHCVNTAKWTKGYAAIDFSNEGTDKEIEQYLKDYFDELSKSIDCFDFDILAHLTCPARYITGRHNRKTDVMIFEDKIVEILNKIIKKNIALEYNTVGFYSKRYGFYNCQNDQVFKLYKELGGELVTLGSDSHSKDYIAGGFDAAIKNLKELGFKYYCFYENREAKEIYI